MNPAVLYISYDGMLEPLGQSQVLAYLERLAKDYTIHLLSFEKIADWGSVERRDEIRARTWAAGIRWHPRRYHKNASVLATAWDIFTGSALGLWLTWRHRIRLLHARSYVPALMALSVKRLTGAKFLFDMRGFWPDERADSGQWSRYGRVFRLAKWFERRFLLSADHVVSLTQAAVREMEQFDYLQCNMPPTTVIPTCANLSRFKPMSGASDKAFTLGYVGTAGTRYRFDATAACFKEFLIIRPDAHFLIINRNEHSYIRSVLAVVGVPKSSFTIVSALPEEMPALMGKINMAVFFIRQCFSVQAMAPTRLGEFLGCGIPCLSNTGVGDMAEILEGERVGVAVDTFDPASLHAGLERLLELQAEPVIRESCVAAAHKHFSLDEGVHRYAEVYQSLLEPR